MRKLVNRPIKDFRIFRPMDAQKSRNFGQTGDHPFGSWDGVPETDCGEEKKKKKKKKKEKKKNLVKVGLDL